MRKRILGSIAVGVMVAWLLPGVSLATEPADVDCDVLQTTLLGIDGAIDFSSGGSLGELYSALVTSPTTFNSFNGLVVFFSGGQISFTSGSQVISTIGSCGLGGFLAGLVNG